MDDECTVWQKILHSANEKQGSIYFNDVRMKMFGSWDSTSRKRIICPWDLLIIKRKSTQDRILSLPKKKKEYSPHTKITSQY